MRRVFKNLLSRRHLLHPRPTPCPRPPAGRLHSVVRKSLPLAAAATAAAASVATALAFVAQKYHLRGGPACSWHASGATTSVDDEAEPTVLPPNHPQSIRVRRIAAHLIATAGDDAVFAQPRLARVGRRRRPVGSIDWKVDVVQDDDVANAYSRYYGEVAITTGMLGAFPRDADVATVLGHEVGHVVAGHSWDAFKRSFWVRVLVNFAGELLGVPAGTIPWEAWEALFTRPSNIGMEFEADRIGLLLLGAAGYNPRVAPAFWFRLGKEDPATAEDYDVAATHPPHTIRAQVLSRTTVMDGALELYDRAVRSGRRRELLVDSWTSVLRLELACMRFEVEQWLRQALLALLPPVPSLWVWRPSGNWLRDSLAMMAARQLVLPSPKSRRTAITGRDMVASSMSVQSIQQQCVGGSAGGSGSGCNSKLQNDDADFLSRWEAMLGAHCAGSAHARRMFFLRRQQRDLMFPRAAKHLVSGHDECVLCLQDQEPDQSPAHAAFNCCYAKRVWRSVLSWAGVHVVFPPAVPSADVWWRHLRSSVAEGGRDALDALFVLVVWHLWTERDAKLSGQEERTSTQLAIRIKEEMGFAILSLCHRQKPQHKKGWPYK